MCYIIVPLKRTLKIKSPHQWGIRAEGSAERVLIWQTPIKVTQDKVD